MQLEGVRRAPSSCAYTIAMPNNRAATLMCQASKQVDNLVETIQPIKQPLLDSAFQARLLTDMHLQKIEPTW
jgi:hypothetical protein